MVFLFLGIPGYSQSDSTHMQELEEVVVTGQYQPQYARSSVYQVRTISKERILNQGATKLQDVLSNELNIRFAQDLATGGSNINLMGLSGQNVKILLDGVPLTGRQGTSNEIDINQVDIQSIERIEIIEGPMSVIYGADALAGVINIITVKPHKESLNVKARMQEETSGREYGFDQGIHNQHAEVKWANRKWKLGAGGGRNFFGGWKGNAKDRELEWHRKEQLLGNVMAGYSASRWNVYYKTNLLQETITNPGAFSNGEAIDQDYITRRLMHQLQGAVQLSDRFSYQGLAALTSYSREIYSTTLKENGDRRLALGSGMQDMTRFSGLVLRGTLLYKLSPAVSIQPGYDINLESGEGERLKQGTRRVNDYAGFVSAEISPVPAIKLRPGIRFANNSVYDAPPVIPSFNTKFLLGNRLDLRLAYAKGFRAPSIRELYFYFFDASHQIEGNTDLKAETSNSFTGSLEWTILKKDALSFTSTLNVFYNDVQNLISVGESRTNATVFTYLNVAKYKTRGLNIQNKFRYRHLEASLGAAYIGRYNDYSEEDKALPEFKWSIELNSYTTYTFDKSGLTASLFYKYTGKLTSYQVATVDGEQQVRLTETAGYHWADLSVSKKLFGVFTLNAGVRNLFNVTRISNTSAGSGAHSEGGPRPIGYGRSFFAGILFNWTKRN